MSFQFPKPESITLPIKGSDNGFPVNHVYCVGRNYKAHIREMGADVKEPPLFFSKPNKTKLKKRKNFFFSFRFKFLKFF